MRKYLLCLVLSAILMLAGTSAYATNVNAVNAVPDAEQLLQMIPADLQQQAKAGSSLLESEDLKGNGFTIAWGENDGTNYILKLSSPGQADAAKEDAKYGVFDFTADQWRIPCKYDGIYFIPDHRYFLVMQGEEKSICYEAEADGTVNPEPLPIDGKVCGVDRQGYVTLYRTFEVEISRYGGMDSITVPYCLRALLDNHYQMILDYVAGSDYPGIISFKDGVTMIRTGGTGFSAGKMETIWNDSTVGFINRKGEVVGSHDYYDAYHFSSDASNDRIWGERIDGETCWVVEDGGAVVVESPFAGNLENLCSDWAKDAIEQAKSRGLISEKFRGIIRLTLIAKSFVPCS